MPPAGLNAWRENSGFVAWPSLGLAFGVALATVGLWVARFGFELPLWAGFPVAFLCAYVSFTVVHEATHGNLGGTRHPWIDTAAGWIFAWWLLAPFPAFQAIHLRHHAAVNEPDRDPDHLVAAHTGPALLVRCLAIAPWYWWFFLGPLCRDSVGARARRPVVVAGGLLMLAALAASAAVGRLPDLLLLWVVPAILADALLAFAFDWLPHHPHQDTSRHGNTRLVHLPRPLQWALLGQSWHLIHHLWPRVPWYRYQTVWLAAAPELREKGVREWTPFASPPREERV